MYKKEEMDFNHFEKTYSFESLRKTDVNVHNIMLNNFFKNYPNKDELVVFDVGCNAGSFIDIVKKHSNNIDLHCFEPHPRLSELIKQNHKDIKLNNFCLSNKNGDCIIYIPNQSVLVSSIINRPVFELYRTKAGADGTIQKVYEYKTKTKTIDSYCEENNIKKIDYLKIDVEGAEFMVLEGAKKMLKSKLIKGGQFEHGSTLEDAGTSLLEISNFLNDYGYEIHNNLSKSDILFMLKK